MVMVVVEDECEVGLFYKDWVDVRDAASSMFKDALEEFLMFSVVKRYVEEWKCMYFGLYKSMYMLVFVFNFFVFFV